MHSLDSCRRLRISLNHEAPIDVEIQYQYGLARNDFDTPVVVCRLLSFPRFPVSGGLEIELDAGLSTAGDFEGLPGVSVAEPVLVLPLTGQDDPGRLDDEPELMVGPRFHDTFGQESRRGALKLHEVDLPIRSVIRERDGAAIAGWKDLDRSDVDPRASDVVRGRVREEHPDGRVPPWGGRIAITAQEADAKQRRCQGKGHESLCTHAFTSSHSGGHPRIPT